MRYCNANSSRLVYTLSILLVAFSGLARAVDSGDLFLDRPIIEGVSGTISGSTVGATRESGEPEHAGLSGGSSVWRSWTAPATGPVTFDTVGSDFDTLLAVYVGNAVDALTVVATSDDIQWPGNLLSELTFYAQAGVTYAIAIDGFQGVAGTFALTWLQDPVPPSEYTLSLDASGHGRIRVNGNLHSLPYSQTFSSNAQVLIEAVPLGGWVFTGWSGHLTGTTSPSVVKMTGNWSITAEFSVDSTLNLVNVPWYVDAAGPATSIPPKDGRLCTIVYLNNMNEEALDCFIEYYTSDGVYIGPFDENAFTIPAGASLAFRPVADDPATVMGGQEGELGRSVPNRPMNNDGGNDSKANGSLVIRFAGEPSYLTGQVQMYSNGVGLGAFSTSYTLPPSVGPNNGAGGVCVTNVPWYVDSADVGQGIPPRDGARTTLVYLHNNKPYEITCIIEYYTSLGVFIGPSTDRTFVIPPNASLAFRPVADDPASAPMGQEAPLGLAVPNRPRNTDNGNDGKANGSIRIKWLGHPDDVQGMVSTFSYNSEFGAHGLSSVLPRGVMLPPNDGEEE